MKFRSNYHQGRATDMEIMKLMTRCMEMFKNIKVVGLELGNLKGRPNRKIILETIHLINSKSKKDHLSNNNMSKGRNHHNSNLIQEALIHNNINKGLLIN
jgi:hypothetical protein